MWNAAILVISIESLNLCLFLNADFWFIAADFAYLYNTSTEIWLANMEMLACLAYSFNIFQIIKPISYYFIRIKIIVSNLMRSLHNYTDKWERLLDNFMQKISQLQSICIDIAHS